jgi:hypothetical protein
MLFTSDLLHLHRCPNHGDNQKGRRASWYVYRWTSIYLKDALSRLQEQLKGYKLSIEDVYAFQHLCAYEVGLVSMCWLFAASDDS